MMPIKKSAKTANKKQSTFVRLIKKYKIAAIAIVAIIIAVAGYFGYSAYQDLNANAASLGACGTLKQGSKGTCVTELQKALNDKSCAGLATDGSFGPATKAAVIAFQKSKGLAQDGSVGKITKSSLISAPLAQCKNNTSSPTGSGVSPSSKGWTDGKGTLRVLDSKKGTSATLVASVCKQEVSSGKYKVKARVRVTNSTITTAGKIAVQMYPARGSDLFGNTITASTGNISTSGWSEGNVISTNWISVWVSVGSSGYTLDTSADASLGRVIIATSDAANCA